MLYNLIRLNRPSRIIEIGSGQSTLMARHALHSNGQPCEHTCVEPYEAKWLENTGVNVIRERVENVPLSIFDDLGEGDILFIDSSHVIRPCGDVLREFLEIVPRLKPGVLVHVHDIFTPRDYPERWLRSERRLWNEQYLLEAFLSFNSRVEVLCALNWLKHGHYDALKKACPMLRPDSEPGAFWFKIKSGS
jgi:predicted O-methyltransferase YrrM